MPAATPATVRTQIKQGTPAPIYLIVGDDDAEMARLTADISAIVEDELIGWINTLQVESFVHRDAQGTKFCFI